MINNLEDETMATKSNLNVNVDDNETELIGSTETDSNQDREFSIGNGEKEISATAWGSNTTTDWEEIKTIIIGPHGYDKIIILRNHYFNCKLTGKTTNQGDTSIVDAFFTYTPPSSG
jgi:hypothetical protein